MSEAVMASRDLLSAERFPRASGYNPEWILASVSGGANAIWLTEWLAEAMELRRGMRVLDLGCGKAVSSIFLNREFGVQVWAVDLLVNPSENLQRIADAGAADGVFPLRVDARSLPFARGFFDAIICIDAFIHFGTDDAYLGNLLRFLKPGGIIGIAGAGLVNEFEEGVPEHLQAWWLPETPDINCLHSAHWWKRHWARSGLLDVELADTMPDGWSYWLNWLRTIAPGNTVEIQALEADQGRWLGYTRTVARRNGRILNEPPNPFPESYQSKPLLRQVG